MTDDEIQKLADTIIEHLRVQHLSVKPDDILIIEAERGLMTPTVQDGLMRFIRDSDLVKRACLVDVLPGRGDLKFTVLNREKKNANL